MDLNLILKEKKEKNIQLKKDFWLVQKNKPLGLIKISDKILIKELRDGLVVLPIWFIIEIDWIETEKLWKNIIATSKINEKDLIWFDFVVCDDEVENLNKYLEKWITPIVSNTSPLISIFNDFNPVKSEWNSFQFASVEKWSIFYSLARYLENFKFSYDNRNLVKNVLAT